MSGNGFIKLYRSMIDWEWFQDANATRVFLYLLLDANHSQKRWMGTLIEPGQTITSRQKIAKKLGISEQQVRTALTKLKSTSEITITATNKYTLVTIVKWASYQSDDEKATSKTTSKPPNEQPTNNQQITTNKNDKNDKKNIYGSFSNVKLTDDELQKLKDKFPDWQKKVDDLSAYIASKGKRYASHYATILTWARKDEPAEGVRRFDFKN